MSTDISIIDLVANLKIKRDAFFYLHVPVFNFTNDSSSLFRLILYINKSINL